MSPGVLIDSNVLIDVTDANSAYHTWALEQVAAAINTDAAVINPIIFAEVAAGFATAAELEAFLPPNEFRRDPLPYDAAIVVSQAFIAYRRRGGVKASPLPDFYIGAHASVAGHQLLTRDVQRFSTYFPDLKLIRPSV